MKTPNDHHPAHRPELASIITTKAARDFGAIKHNFKTRHKRPPGPGADNSL